MSTTSLTLQFEKVETSGTQWLPSSVIASMSRTQPMELNQSPPAWCCSLYWVRRSHWEKKLCPRNGKFEGGKENHESHWGFQHGMILLSQGKGHAWWSIFEKCYCHLVDRNWLNFPQYRIQPPYDKDLSSPWSQLCWTWETMFKCSHGAASSWKAE